MRSTQTLLFIKLTPKRRRTHNPKNSANILLTMHSQIQGLLDAIPDDAAGEIRRHWGLSDYDALRVTYLPGPGDVAGTFDHWSAGQHDPRVPTIAYSLMFYELMKHLGAECQIIGTHPIGRSEEHSSSPFHFLQVTSKPASNRWRRIRSQREYTRELVQLVAQFDPHVVIASTDVPALSWEALSRGRRLVLSAHNTFWLMGDPPRNLKWRIRRMLLSHQAKSLDGAICTSHECARQISILTAGRIQGEVECPQIVQRYPVEARDHVKRMLFLGRIERSKGIFLLVDTFEKLATMHPELELLIAGSGSADGALKTKLAASPNAKQIKFLGRLGSDAVHSTIAATDLLVCPTMSNFNEGLAVVGFEAAAHGIPTVLSSVVPAAELLGEGCAIYQADNAIALESTLGGLIADPETYRKLCAATALVREKIYDRSLSWSSGLFRTLMK